MVLRGKLWIVLNFISKKGFKLRPILFCINKGEPQSIKPIKNNKINIGNKKINPIDEKKKSQTLIIYVAPFV